MKNFPSEQILNDGGYCLPQLVNAANKRLKQIGKHGKRATIKVTPKPNAPISAQFTFNGEQSQRGLDIALNRINLAKAEEICTLITSQLMAGTYSDDWLNALLGKKNKKPTQEKKILNCGEMLDLYKKYYFKQRNKQKSPKGNWYRNYGHTEKIMNLYIDKPIDLKIIREIIDSTENNSTARTKHLNGLANLLEYFDNKEFKQIIKQYKKENNPKPKKKYIPSDSEIIYHYKFGFTPQKKCPKKYLDSYPKWQFLYALLAIYGLRIHEAWNIKNWNNSVTLENGDWIAVPNDDINNIEDKEDKENGSFSYHEVRKKIIFPAILDPNNQNYLLCIGHNTKTGYRVAFPICPNGHASNCQWIENFNLIQPLNLPNIKNASERNLEGCFNCTRHTTYWFWTHKYGFSPHALRHAYNIRGHALGITQKNLANSLGHGLIMNSSNYLRHENDESKMQGIWQEIENDTYKRNKIKELELKLEKLETENKYLKAENEKLKTELKMYEILKDK